MTEYKPPTWQINAEQAEKVREIVKNYSGEMGFIVGAEYRPNPKSEEEPMLIQEFFIWTDMH